MTLSLAASSFLSFRLSVGGDPTYPANTVSGRLCLGLRLNWEDETRGAA